MKTCLKEFKGVTNTVSQLKYVDIHYLTQIKFNLASLHLRFNGLPSCKIYIFHVSKCHKKYQEQFIFGQGHMAATK